MPYVVFNGGNQPYRWVGSTDIQQGKQRWTVHTDKAEITVPYEGPFNALIADLPTLGTQLAGLAELGFVITSVEIEELDGAMGRMTLTLGTGPIQTVGFESIGVPVYEIEFGELNKPIEAHPRCGFLKPDRPTDQVTNLKHTWADWAELTDADYDDTDIGPTWGATWTLVEYKKLKESGVDNYNVGAPIIRRTLKHMTPPNDMGTNCYRVQLPPSGVPFLGISNWKWLLGPDRCVREGKFYVRTTEWIGSQVISDLIYQTAT